MKEGGTKMDLETQETWQVQDSTKLQKYLECPRRYFYEYVVGWQPEQPSIHLEFGSAWHLAMEILYTKGFSAGSIVDAYEAFETYYRGVFPPEMDTVNNPKIPDNVFRGLPQYCALYARDDFTVHHVEVAGSVMVGDTRKLYFLMDVICEGEQGVFSLEHKTSGRFSTSWVAQWRQKTQIGTYSHALYCMFPQPSVFGVVINGFFPATPRYKQDGELYANSRDNDFQRLPVRRSLDSMEGWLDTVNHWLDLLETDFDQLDYAREDDHVLRCFHKNTEMCSNYGQCPYLDYCASWHNPLQHAGAPPVGFVERHWDPRRSLERAGKVVEL